MKEIYLGLKFSLSYFSILPISFKENDDLGASKVLSSMLFFFSFIGLLIASITVLLYTFFFSSLGIVGAVISSVIYMMLYGFIHTEAILDVVDALYASHSGKNPYEVIKEPHIGAMGMLWGAGFVIIKVALLASLLEKELFFPFMVVAMMSRWNIVFLIKQLQFKSTFVETLQKALSLKTLLLSLILVCSIGYILIGVEIIIFVFVALLSSFLIAKFIGKKLTFFNGDVLGATLESTEILLFLLSLKIISF